CSAATSRRDNPSLVSSQIGGASWGSGGLMSVVTRDDVCTAFFERLRQASSRVLLLDYDGTLAPFTPDREHAFPYPGIPELISRIVRAGTRVVLVSGRAA